MKFKLNFITLNKVVKEKNTVITKRKQVNQLYIQLPSAFRGYFRPPS